MSAFDLFNVWETSPTLDTSTQTPPPAIVSTAGDALTQAQTGVSEGWGWLNTTLQRTIDAVAQIGVAKYAAKNGVAVTATAPLAVQDPRTGQLVQSTGYVGAIPQQQQGPGLLTLGLVAAVIFLVTRK